MSVISQFKKIHEWTNWHIAIQGKLFSNEKENPLICTTTLLNLRIIMQSENKQERRIYTVWSIYVCIVENAN